MPRRPPAPILSSAMASSPLAAAGRALPAAAEALGEPPSPPAVAAAWPHDAPPRLHSIIDNVKSVVFQTDAQGCWTFLNRAWTEITGHAVADCLGRLFLDYVHPDDRAGNQAAFEPLIARRKEHCRHQVRYLTVDGRSRWIEVYARLTLEADDRIVGTSGTLTDVTERHEAEERLRLAASVFDNAGEGIVITDTAARIVDVNAAFCAITGYAREQVIGRTPAMLASGRQDAAFYREMWRSLTDDGQWSGEIWNRRADGAVYAELLRISSVRGPDGAVTHFVGIFTDVTVQKRYQETLERLAHYDVLTGLPNRALMLDRLTVLMRQADRQGGCLALCYLDLDGFKDVNDRWGHATGDQLLLQAADRLRGLLRGADTVARLGGDEFVLLLGEVQSGEEAQALLDRVRRALCVPYELGCATATVTPSIGVALYPDHGSTADYLLRNADQAMYRAKRQGKNCVCLVAPTDRAALEREALRDALRAGLAAGELRLHYQPKVDARSRQVVGAEALVRWQHPHRGLLGPGQFLQAVAGTPLEVELDLWVMDQALAQLARWQRAGHDLVMSINLSAATMTRPELPGQLAQRIARCGAQARGRLELEVVETAALQDVHGAAQAMQACAELGVQFALDDFGTGYSSLAYLSQLPVHTLKIDQGFVRDMLDDASDMHIVKAVIGLARAFGVRTVAEGVETEAQAQCLAALGCELLQGYHIARGLPAEAFDAWMAGQDTHQAPPAADEGWVI
jgi:diguanylate cyclase (GGDEF)-like protein/PAS domain S-box-containing protein